MDKMKDHIVYKNIKKTRQEKGLSQNELARRVGYADKTMISHIENGKIDISTSKLEEIAKALNVSPGYLLGWTDNPDPDFPFTEEAASNMQKNIDRLVGKKDGYYINPETAELAQKLFENEDMRILFDAADGSRPEDLKRAADFLIMLKATNPEG